MATTPTNGQKEAADPVIEMLDRIRKSVLNQVPQIIALRETRSQKEDQSFVTEGDLLVNDLITGIAHEYGDATIISEERLVEVPAGSAGYLLVVDPIDGTENFTSGLPEWGLSVACFRNDRHVGSLIGCPEMNRWLRTGEDIPNFFSRIRGLSSSLQKEELIRATQGYEYRMMGCCVYNMINVIRGSFLSFENPKGASSWDILGGLNLAREHNLKVLVNDKEYTGEYLPPDKKYRFWVGR